MAAMLVLNGLIIVNVSTWLFNILQAQGLILFAAVALGALIGPVQVRVRVLEMAGLGRHHPIWTLAFSTFAIAAGILLLAADYGVAGVALVLYGGATACSRLRGALFCSPSSARIAIPLSWGASHDRRSLLRRSLLSLEHES